MCQVALSNGSVVTEFVGAIDQVVIASGALAPNFQIRLRSATGTADVIFQGRRIIPGFTLGKEVRVRGQSVRGGFNRFFNPSYEML